jgi:HemY protein
MIRALLLIIAFGAGSVFLAQWLKDKGAGYVLIYFDHYSLETSVWFLFLFIISGFFGLFILYHVLSLVFGLIFDTGRYAKNFRKKRQLEKNAQGLLAYHSEYWQQAGKLLYTSAESTEKPFISYMLSAKSYLKLNDIACAKDALEKAAKCETIDRVSLSLADIDLAIAEGDANAAEQALNKTLDNYPKEPRVLLKAAEIYHHLPKNTPENIINPIRKQALMSKDAIDQLAIEQITREFRNTQDTGNVAALDKIYKKAKGLQQHPECYMSYFNALKKQHDIPHLMDVVERQLKHHAATPALTFYASISHDKARQASFLESLEETQGKTADLLMAQARVAFALEDKSKALNLAKASLQMDNETPLPNDLLGLFES